MSKVLEVRVTLSSDSIAKANSFFRERNIYHKGLEKNYDSDVTRALYKDKA